MPPSASSAIVRPPEAEPVNDGEHIGRDGQRHQRTALDREHPVAHHREGGQRRDDRAEADEAGDAQHRQDGRIGAGVHAVAQRRQAPIVDRDQDDDGGRERGDDRPHAPDRGERRRAPCLVGEKGSVDAWQDEQRHEEIDATTTTSGRAASAIGGPTSL